MEKDKTAVELFKISVTNIKVAEKKQKQSFKF
jgi:hypothetical protein